MEYEVTRCYYNFNCSGDGNSKNNKTGTMRYLRIMVSKEFSKMMAIYGVFPEIRQDYATKHFGCLHRLHAFWINGSSEYESEALGFIEKFRGSKNNQSRFRCFSSDFQKSLSNETLMLYKDKRGTCPMTAWVPFVLVLMQSCFDNMDRTKTRDQPILRGGSVNGRCPSLKVKSKKGDAVDVNSAPPNRNPLQNIYLYSPAIRGMTAAGGLVTTDTQVILNSTTARRGNKAISRIDAPCGLGFGAAFLFEPLDSAMQISFKNDIKTLLRQKKRAKVDDDFDLMALSFDDEAEEVEPEEDDDTPPPAKQPRVKAGPIADKIYAECEHLQDIATYNRYIKYYLAAQPKPSMTSTGIGSDSEGNDDGRDNNPTNANDANSNTTKKLAEVIQEAREYHESVSESTKRLEQEICNMAGLLNLEGSTSCLSLLIHKTIQHINNLARSVEAPNIKTYLKYAAVVPRLHPKFEHCELKLKHLRHIVEAFGVVFNSNWNSVATDTVLLTDNKLETGLASIKFVGNTDNVGGLVYDMIASEQEGATVDLTNIIQAQKQWMQHGWISNFQHMKNRGYDRSKFDRIKMIIWVKEDTVYKDLRRIMYNEDIDDSSGETDEDPVDEESDDILEDDSESNDGNEG